MPEKKVCHPSPAIASMTIAIIIQVSAPTGIASNSFVKRIAERASRSTKLRELTNLTAIASDLCAESKNDFNCIFISSSGMSEMENSGMPEADSEIETQAATADMQLDGAHKAALTETTSLVSNQEVMMAQTLSRLKKQSKQLDKVDKALAQLPSQFKGLEKKQSKQFNQIERQIRQVQLQVKQLQKQVTGVKTSTKKKKKASRKR